MIQLSEDAHALKNTFISVVEDSDSHILIVDREFRIISFNPALHWIFLSAFNIHLKHGTSILHLIGHVKPELAQLWRERCVTALNGDSVKAEDVYEVEGRPYYWESYFKRIVHGDFEMISILSRDITLRKFYFKKVVESEANLRSIFNAIGNSACLINQNLEVIDFNPACARLFKRLSGKRLIKTANFFDHLPDDPESNMIKQLVCDGLQGRSEKCLIRLVIRGSVRFYEFSTYPIREDLSTTGLTLYCREVTQQKQSEDKLQAQNEDLTRINQELDRFLYSVSHDLRAPVLSIQGLTNLIEADIDNPDGKENLKQYVAYINKSLKRLDNFILDVTNYTLNSKTEARHEIIDLKTLIDDVIQSLAFTDGFERVKKIITVTSLRPLLSDARRLSIILSNLISNAVKYRDDHKSWSYLRIEVVIDDHLIIILKDNGIGIPSQYQQKIFSMFYRASEQGSGTGLGLFIVKNVVETMNGSISFESEFGRGTQFTIVLPNLFSAVKGVEGASASMPRMRVAR